MLSETPFQPVLLPLKTLYGKYHIRVQQFDFIIFLRSSRNNYATFKEIRTKTIAVQGSRGDSKKAKLFITLARSPDFFENMKKFNEIREENERLAAKNVTPAEGDAK